MAEIRHPLIISSRLMAALKLGDAGTLHLHAEGRTAEGRVQYLYVIEDGAGNVLEEDTSLSSGVGAEVDYLVAMCTLLGFLDAAGESSESSENSDLFGEPVMEWAREHSDEIGMWLATLSDPDGE